MTTNEILRELQLKVASAGLVPNGKRISEFAEVIIESIEPNRLTLDLFNRLFMPTRRLNPGDSLQRRIKNRGYPVRIMVPGTEHLASQPVPPRQVMAYNIDYLIAKVSYNLFELRSGDIQLVGDLRRDLRDSIVDNMVARVFSLLATVWNSANTPNNYATVAGGLTEPVLSTMIENVLEQAGSIRSIVGTRKALLKLYEFAGVKEHVITGGTAPTNVQVIPIQNPLDEWSRSNRVTSFRGIPVVELPQVFERSADNYTKKLIPDNLVLVIGDNAGEIILYGDFETQEHVDTGVEPAQYSLSTWVGYGMMVDFPEHIGVIEIV